ncbi:NAD(P)-dependent oxidoreductase [Saccharopolyspora sp. WRP15-2]|uniref:NAD(P)-dependent oxidoreductase n=1 Tax=Saccharopolyspora oryzae TaxID=2997343 RepID=A0ABT4V784_9PSEU|nr:NAD(P)-dependent oxidoreductase [Saccharopolyspora oryzae]MDA3629132.1 NAD(P)-dependent oxidoreductase [Saccharopolyspora oryzae]
MKTVAIIGFGDMGEQMVPHLLSRGHAVRVHDIDPAKRQRASAAGAEVLPTAADAARGADVVVGLVMSDDIPAAYLGEDGILAGTAPGAAVLVCSTTTPALLDSVVAAAPDGVTVLDAPIVGGVKYARERRITFLVGAPDDAFERVRPVLDALGTSRQVGGVGSGVAYKLITNVAIMAAEAGIREALDMADYLGQDYATALDLMSVGPMSAVVTRALDTTNPRPLRRSAEDDDTLLSAVDDPARQLPISHAGATRLWEAVNATEDFEPDFVDLTRRTTARPEYRRA